VRGDPVQVVRGDHHRESVVVELVDQVHHVVPGPNVDARRRLVHQQELRAAQHRSRHEDPLLLPAGELPDVPAAQVADPQPVEHLVGLAQVAFGGPREDPPVDPGHQDGLANGHGEVPVDGLDLRHVPDGRRPIPHDRTSDRSDHARDRAQQRRLAAPARTDDPDEVAFGHGQVHVDQHRLHPVPAGDPLEPDELVHVS
jgi:hypothetical protein